MKFGLSENQIKEIISHLENFHEIEEAVIFGSRAIGTQKNGSDIDIAIKGKDVSATVAAKIKSVCEEESSIPFFFDFVAYQTINNKELKEHIDTRGIVLYRKKRN